MGDTSDTDEPAAGDATPATAGEAAVPTDEPADEPTRETPEPTKSTEAPTEPATQPPAPRFTRRQALALAGTAGLIGAGALAARLVGGSDLLNGDPADPDPGTTSVTGSASTAAGDAPTTGGARWSDPATWGGAVPQPDDLAVIDRPVLLDVDVTVAGVRIEASGELIFDAGASRTLTSTANVVVAGVLRAQPQAHDIDHVVAFAGIDEGAIVGGHVSEPVETDVGLWVVGDGVLDLHGTPKRPWTHLAGPVGNGADTIEVDDAEGWQAGDEVVVTATAPTSVGGYAELHDRRTVTAVDGATVSLDRPLEFDHPTVTVRPGETRHAEVLNLTRNVRVEGSPDGRAHVMMVGVTAPQTVSHVGLRHLGPQTDLEDGGYEGALGRYALHFHMSHDGSRGSVIEGVVAYEGGNHAFVSHLSDGVTFRECIAHDQAETPFWWDGAEDHEEPGSVPTNDLVYERCVAHLVHPTTTSRYGVAGFLLGTGRGNIARGCVASGVQANDESSPGFQWTPDSRDEEHTWTFEDCVSHNNNGASLYHWINVVPRTIVDRFTAYHDRHGIRAGAYSNLVSYRDTTVYACEEAGLVIVAVPDSPMDHPDETITYEGLHVDQAGLTEFAVHVTEHVVSSDRTTKVTGCHFAGGTTAQVGFPDPGEHPQVYEFTDCTFDGNAFWLADPLTDSVAITVRDDVHGALALRPADQAGELREEWNARVTPA